MNNMKNILGGFLAGALLGAAAGILMAPSSGTKTRKKLLKESKKLTDSAERAVADSINKFRTGFNKNVDEYAEAGQKAIGRSKEKVKI